MLVSRSRPLLAVIAMLVAGLALLSGCGGDSGPQTKEGFILEADGVCESFLGEFSEAGSQNPTTPKQVADANNVLADLYERFGERIGDLRLPAGGAARTQARAYVNSVRGSKPLLDRLRLASDDFLEAAEIGEPRALQTAGANVRSALDAFRATRSASDLLAVDYGLNLCGNLD